MKDFFATSIASLKEASLRVKAVFSAGVFVTGEAAARGYLTSAGDFAGVDAASLGTKAGFFAGVDEAIGSCKEAAGVAAALEPTISGEEGSDTVLVVVTDGARAVDLAALDEASLKGHFLAGAEVTIGNVVLGAGGSCGFATNFLLVEAKVQNLSFSVKRKRCVALISEAYFCRTSRASLGSSKAIFLPPHPFGLTEHKAGVQSTFACIKIAFLMTITGSILFRTDGKLTNKLGLASTHRCGPRAIIPGSLSLSLIV